MLMKLGGGMLAIALVVRWLSKYAEKKLDETFRDY